MHGLTPEKLCNPDVIIFCNSHDILLFDETWLRSEEQIPAALLEEFHCMGTFAAKSSKGRPAGGSLCCVRKTYGVPTLLKRHTQADIIWLRIPAAPLDLILGLCYLPPENAPKWRAGVDPFTFLRADILELQGLGLLLLSGDINARTATASDFLPLSADDPIPPPRHNSDPGTNGFGTKLLALAQESGLIILNGRVPGDKHGACTYESKAQEGACSLVDYFLCPLEYFSGPAGPEIQLVVLHDISFRAISDHWPLSLTLPPLPPRITRPARRRRRRQKPGKQRWIWAPDAAERYSEEIYSCPITSETSNINSTTDSIETLLDLLKTSINDAASRSQLPRRPLIPRPQRKPPFFDAATARWYGPACMHAFLRLKASRGLPGKETRQAVRHYKCAVRRAKRTHIRARQAYLADLILHKPQRFWKLARPNPSAPCTIPSRTLHKHFQNLRAQQAPTGGPRPIIPPPPRTQTPLSSLNPHAKPFFPTATSLNAPFTIPEVNTAMHLLKTGKTADGDGSIMELLLHPHENGCFKLAPFLTQLANKCFLTSSFPASESTGHIIPLYKGKGDPASPDNYRGITIISVFAKLYATIINARISAWRLANPQQRAYGQGGFLRHHRTEDHLFTLQHIIDKYRVRSFKPPGSRYKQPLPLLACFVDLTKAFDTVNRHKLWNRLNYLGIRGPMLQAIQSYYSDVSERVLTESGFSPSFSSSVGVKQGCPLSPTLFGIFIDAFEAYLLEHRPLNNWTCEIMGRRVPLLLYADDLVLFATSEGELQTMLDLLDNFTQDNDLTVNLAKTAVVAFSRARCMTTVNVHFQMAPVQQLQTYRYLGIIFHWRSGIKHGAVDRIKTARKALFSLEKHIHLQHIFDIPLAIKLFSSLVTSTLVHGAACWGPFNHHSDASTLQLGFLKRLLHLPSSTDSSALLNECDCSSINTIIIQRIHAYWNRLVNSISTHPSRLLSQAFKENMELFNRSGNCWTKHVALRLRLFQQDLEDNYFRTGTALPDIRTQVDGENRALLSSSISDAPTDARDLYLHHTFLHASNDRRRTYARWFMCDFQTPPIKLFDTRLRSALLRFRLGAHDLRVVTGSRPPRIPRQNRLCLHCDMQIVEDEAHLVFECPHYHPIRARFPDLFHNFCISNTIIISDLDSHMHQFFGQPNQGRIAKFIRACLLLRCPVLT